VNSKYFLTIRTGHRSLSSESLPEKGVNAGIKKALGSRPGIEVFARNPGTTLIDIPCAEKIRSRGSLDRACNSPLRLVEARANKKTVFQVHLILSWRDVQRGGSNSDERSNLSTRDKSHSGTLGLSGGTEVLKDFIKLDRLELNDNDTPSTGLMAEVIAVL
jgi:hypothetical protein